MVVVVVVLWVVMKAMVMDLAVMIADVVVHLGRHVLHRRLHRRGTVIDAFRLVFDLIQRQENSGGRSRCGRDVPIAQVGFVSQFERQEAAGGHGRVDGRVTSVFATTRSWMTTRTA